MLAKLIENKYVTYDENNYPRDYYQIPRFCKTDENGNPLKDQNGLPLADDDNTEMLTQSRKGKAEDYSLENASVFSVGTLPEKWTGDINDYVLTVSGKNLLIGNLTASGTDNYKNFLRQVRQYQCFSVINRGKLWYDKLTAEQVSSLANWYAQWLNVTESLIVPYDLDFID